MVATATHRESHTHAHYPDFTNKKCVIRLHVYITSSHHLAALL